MECKRIKHQTHHLLYLQNVHLTLIFSKHSTRTRTTFEIGVQRSGGYTTFLDAAVTQLARGESILDSSRVISALTDVIVVRTTQHYFVSQFAKYAKASVINGLSNEFHPCQVAADIFTFWEHRNKLSGCIVAWVGDMNNMLMTWIQAAKIFNLQLHLCLFRGNTELLSCAENCKIYTTPQSACHNANLVTTDTIKSMGCDNELITNHNTIDEHTLNVAQPSTLFMHCLPAYRRIEAVESVIDGSRSIIYGEALNRLYFQIVLIKFLLSSHN